MNNSTNKASLWQQSQRIFDKAITLPIDQRKDYVKSQCADSEELYKLIIELLDADQPTRQHNDNTLAVAIVDALDNLETDKYLSLELDNYRLLRKIGQGGMGTVFYAERNDDSFHKKVAIKIMRAGFGSDDRQRRFIIERQILADLEHPQIARLLDGGTTPDGQPYVVMEYVDGQDIIKYADTDQLTITQRLALFRECCAVIQYAHDHLVVHRDIKPSNLLIDQYGNLKLLDFGIAKMLESGTEQEQTEQLARLLTPSYASPEQVLGKPITTTSDVYSLGVLLYELLSGSKPYNHQELTPKEFENTLLNKMPPPLDSWFDTSNPHLPTEFNPEAVARARNTSVEKLQKTLRGDLNSIVLKAMASEQQSRYYSTQALSTDIQRYLEGRPILARPASLTYKAIKLARRRTPAVIASMAALVFIVVFIAMTIFQAKRVERERDVALEQKQRAESVTGFLVDTYESFNPAATLGEQITARQVLNEGVKRLDEQLQPELQVDLLQTMGKVYGHLGLYSESESLLQKALAIHDNNPDTEPADRAQLLHLIARNQVENGQYKTAINTIQEAIPLRDPNRPDAKLLQASDLKVMARAHNNLENYATAEKQYGQALDLLREATGDNSHEVALTINAMATALDGEDSEQRADRLYQQSLKILRQHFHGDHPSIAETLLALSHTHRNLDQLPSAESYAADAIAMLQRVYDEPHPDLAIALNSMGLIQKELENYSLAADYYIESLEIKRSLLGDEHPRVAMSLFNLAYIKYLYTDDLDGAESDFREALEIGTNIWEYDHKNIYKFRASLGFVLSAKGQLDEAESLFRQCLEILSAKQPYQNYQADIAKITSQLANVLIKRGQIEQAKALLDSSVPVLIEEYGMDDADTQRALAWQQSISSPG